jgi:hypothetical protein
MKMLLPSLALLLLVAEEAPAIKITLFSNTETFVEIAKDIVIAKCIGPVPDDGSHEDGLYPVFVEVIVVLKGTMKPGKAKIATIYPMESGRNYMLTSLGGSAYGTNFLAVPQLAVVEVPARFRLDDLKGKPVLEQVRAVFTARRDEIERQRPDKEKRLLDKAVAK